MPATGAQPSVAGEGPNAGGSPATSATGGGDRSAADATGAAGTAAVDDPAVDATMGEDLVSPAAADATADESAAADAELPRPPCLQNGNQVVLIGDSYINWVSHTFPADLNREAGQTFRMYAVGGYSMGSGGIGPIPPQIDQAIADDPDITTIVMTGGGNDILVPDTLQFPQGGDCKMTETAPMIADCRAIVDLALAAADDMMGRVETLDNKITHVVYFFYPNVPQPTVVGGTAPNAILDYAAPLVQEFCDGTFERSGGKIQCHFVDLRPVFEGHPEYFAPTDIHPNLAGSAAMAEAIWQKMQQQCLAQPASSGCCEP